MKFGDSNNNSFVLNCPKNFDLNASIQKADEVFVITAYAHETGWKLIKDAIKSTSAHVELLTGLDFCQTEPGVLKQWLSKSYRHVIPYLYTGKTTFHPKVMIVRGRSKKNNFVIVGSGNMSQGGFIKNVECNVYINEASQVSELTNWYKGLIKKDASRLNEKMIKNYLPKYESSKKSIASVKNSEISALADIKEGVLKQASMADWSDAIRDAELFLKDDQTEWFKDHHRAVKKMKRLLHFPEFDFGYDQWSEFYDVWQLGHLIAIPKKSIFKQKPKLQKGFRQLVNEEKSVAERLDYIIDNDRKTGIQGVNLNTATKILTVSNPDLWPVHNAPIKKALDYYGYKAPRTSSKGEKYAAFADLMQQFVKDTGLKDMIQLDCFFFWVSRELIEQ
mgnify:CR=1 FL=1